MTELSRLPVRIVPSCCVTLQLTPRECPAVALVAMPIDAVEGDGSAERDSGGGWLRTYDTRRWRTMVAGWF
jgi:hypothetical protein